MIALPEPVARELERREPFPNAEAKEATTVRLLQLWHAMQPSGTGGAYELLWRRRSADRR